MRFISDRSPRAASQNRTIALVAVGALLLLGNFWLFETRDVLLGRQIPIDFHAYYVASETFSRGLNPYLDQSVTHPDLGPEVGRNSRYSSLLYPPTLLPFYALVARLDVTIASWGGPPSRCSFSAALRSQPLSTGAADAAFG